MVHTILRLKKVLLTEGQMRPNESDALSEIGKHERKESASVSVAGNCQNHMFVISRLAIFGRFRKISKSVSYLLYVCPFVPVSAWNNSTPTGRIFIQIDIWVFYKNLLIKSWRFV